MLNIEEIEKLHIPQAYKVVRAHIIESRNMWPILRPKYIQDEWGLKMTEWAHDEAHVRFMVACANEIRTEALEQIDIEKVVKSGRKEKFYRFDDGTYHTITMLSEEYKGLNKNSVKSAVNRLEVAGGIISKNRFSEWAERYKKFKGEGEGECGSVSQ